MSVSRSDQQRIYLAYRSMFSGNFAMIRASASIEKQLKRKYGDRNIPCVDARLSRKTVVLILQDLLRRCVFQSEATAKVFFPSLPEGQTSGQVMENSDSQTVQSQQNSPLQRTISPSSASERPPELFEQKDDGLPPLQAISIPFQAQYTILTTIQHLLEKSCFCFAQAHLPSLFEAKEWDCAEACELNLWICELLNSKDQLSHAFTVETGPELEALFAAVRRIRHVTVHRKQNDAGQLIQMIQTSIEFLGVLGDVERRGRVQELFDQVLSRIQWLRVKKDLRDTELEYKLQRITHLRTILDRREEEAYAAAKAAEAVSEELVGSMLKGFTARNFPPS